jgi:hypothetical protein
VGRYLTNGNRQRHLVACATDYAGYDGIGRLTSLTHRDGVNAVMASYNIAYNRGMTPRK